MENIWLQQFMVIQSKPGLAFKVKTNKAKKPNNTNKTQTTKPTKTQLNKNPLIIESSALISLRQQLMENKE